MMDVVKELRKVIALSDEKYYLYNEHDVLYLPLHVPVGIPILQFMKVFFEKYKSLLNDSKAILKDCGIDDVGDIIEKVEKFQDAYVHMHEKILSGEANEAYQEMESILNSNEGKEYFITTEIKQQELPLRLYRARTGINWTQKEDFYHIPFNKVYLCNSFRFSIAGYPSLYLGFSPEVCKKEVRGKDCSYIELTLTNTLRVVDLTWDTKHITSKSTSAFLQAYPIIAACYVVPFYCKNMKKECPEVLQTFKEQYIFPQYVTMFIKKYLGVEGIIYFSTRDEDLDPSKDNDKNIALFPKYDGNSPYDEGLIHKFEWGAISIM